MAVLSACSSGLTVRSDIDPSADFSQYKTYNFFEPMGIEGGYNSPVFGELFRESISSEMRGRSYRVADRPDLLINVTIRSDDKIRMRSYTAPYASGGYYGRAGGASGGSALGVGISTGSRATKTTEASVFIDFVDLHPVFREEEDPMTLFLKNNGHWSAAGHELAARTVAEKIRSVEAREQR